MGLMIGMELDETVRRAGAPGAGRRAGDQRHRRQRDPTAAAARDERSRRAAMVVERLAPLVRAFLERSVRSPRPPRARLVSWRAAAFPAVQGFLARRVRARVRAHALDQGQVQALRALLAARGPHAGDDLREAVDPHAHVVRGRHAPARRRRDLPLHARLAARARRAGRGRGAGDLAHVRRDHGAHLRAGDHRALRRHLARAGDQRPDQRVPPLPDPGRRLHLHRAPRPDPRQDGGLDRRLEQRLQHLAAGGGDLRLQAERLHAARL